MTNYSKRILKFLLALVAGYAVMILGLLGSQEGLFGRISYYTTPTHHLFVAGVLSVTSAIAGGAVAGWIFGRSCFPSALAMCGLVVLDTTLLLTNDRLEGPLWFDLFSSAALIVGILFGACLARRWRHANGAPGQ